MFLRHNVIRNYNRSLFPLLSPIHYTFSTDLSCHVAVLVRFLTQDPSPIWNTDSQISFSLYKVLSKHRALFYFSDVTEVDHFTQ